MQTQSAAINERPRIILDEAPKYSLFNPAMLKSFMRKADTPADSIVLPQQKVCLSKQRIDITKLHAFQKVCGYPLSDAVPISYLHNQVFDLQMALLLDETMPLPLLGMVHLEHSISRLKSITPSEQYDLEVFFGEVEPHKHGVTIESRAEIRVDNELIWHETAKTLSRLPKHLLSKTQADTTAKPGFQRPCAETAIVWKAASDLGRRYGKVSGDRNPIHLWPITAKLFGFKRHIAHGMWTMARAAAEFEPDYLNKSICYSTRFLKPVFLPTRLHYYRDDSSENNKIEVWNSNASQCHMIATVSRL